MGVELATEALKRGHQVTVVSGPGLEPFPREARVIPVERAREMDMALRRESYRADAIIMAAAVCDFQPSRVSRKKLTRRGRRQLQLIAVPDIIGRLPRRPRQIVAAFALETKDVISRAKRKLQVKRLDLLLAQRAGGRMSPFGRQPVKAWLLEREGLVTSLGSLTKQEVARLLLDKIEALWYGQTKITKLGKANR